MLEAVYSGVSGPVDARIVELLVAFTRRKNDCNLFCAAGLLRLRFSDVLDRNVDRETPVHQLSNTKNDKQYRRAIFVLTDGLWDADYVPLCL